MKIKNIQKKSLQHVSNMLDSFDSFQVYSKLLDKMVEKGVEDKLRTIIIDEFNKAIKEEETKVKESKAWVDSLIEDFRK